MDRPRNSQGQNRRNAPDTGLVAQFQRKNNDWNREIEKHFMAQGPCDRDQRLDWKQTR
jgi:hypothetical protein